MSAWKNDARCSCPEATTVPADAFVAALTR